MDEWLGAGLQNQFVGSNPPCRFESCRLLHIWRDLKMIKVARYINALTDDVFYLAEKTKFRKRVCGNNKEDALRKLRKEIRERIRK